MDPALLEIQPDTKGPKTLAILLFVSALFVGLMGWQDWQLHHEGLSDDQIQTFLSTPNSQEGEPTTLDDYRAFENEVQTNNGYLVRSLSLLLASGSLFLGAPLLYRLRKEGAVLCIIGAGGGLVGGVWASQSINMAAETHLGEALKLTYQLWVYLCGVLMGICVLMSALPLLNVRARLALNQRVQVMVKADTRNAVFAEEE